MLHKVGIASGKVERRIANARNDPTFLLADVETVTRHELFNIGRSKLEMLILRVVEPACLDIKVKDRFRPPVSPREWFLVPLASIDEAVRRIEGGVMIEVKSHPKQARPVSK
ncbi:MAG: GIY-YIG nuclease family protein [Pseudomonadota bacterium]